MTHITHDAQQQSSYYDRNLLQNVMDTFRNDLEPHRTGHVLKPFWNLNKTAMFSCDNLATQKAADIPGRKQCIHTRRGLTAPAVTD
jgi:hypothetical protein